MKWINRKDRTPEYVEICLVYDDLEVRVGIREWTGWTFSSMDSSGEDGLENVNINHWMPLPDPPEADE